MDVDAKTPPRRRWLTYGILAAAAITAATALAARRPAIVAKPQPTQQAPAQRPRVELVFALDTTSSMSGLIEGAKRKIWSIASFVARGQPAPDLKIGLVAYRDLGDSYVTRTWDLDDDLDRVQARLRQLSAGGGGDVPEHVARALHESVHEISWTAKQEVVKVIYLVGDAPPHEDYQDGFDLEGAARAAARKGIQVHTIRCGTDPSTAVAWRRVASLARGEFLTIQQDGGMRDEATPYDVELGRLHDELSRTTMAYGADAPSVARAVAAAARAPAAEKAERAAFLSAKGKAVGGRGDLLDDIASGAAKLDEVAPAALPAELRALAPEERKAQVVMAQKKRAATLKRISELSAEREKHLERDRAATDGDGFDGAAKKALRKTVTDNALSGLKL